MTTVLSDCFPDAQQRVLQLEAGQRVELRERLVEQQEARLERQRARQRHALLRAERQLPGQLIRRVGNADELEIVIGAGALLAGVGAWPLRGSEQDVLSRAVSHGSRHGD